jgi:predicted permease
LLVAGQVALSVVLLICVALLMESMANLSRVEPGFRPDHLLTMQLSIPLSRYDTVQKNAWFFAELVRRVEALPGVQSAAACRSLPMTGAALTPVQPTDRPTELLSQRPFAVLQEITPAYFRTFEIPLKRGRGFTPGDTPASGLVAVINEKMARQFWPAYPNSAEPVGQHILIGAGPRPVEIVGIAADSHVSLADDPMPLVYRPWAQTTLPWAAFVVRTEGDPLRFANAIRSQVVSIDRDQPVSAVQTMDEVVEADEGQRRLVVRLLGLFAGVALSLTMVGIYGVIAYSVAQRTRELGIRRALGAQPGNIVSLVIREGLGMTLGGVVIGLAGALALTRVMKAFLFQVSATDPLIFAAIALLLALLALTACYIPARRATRIDPMAALRHG